MMRRILCLILVPVLFANQLVVCCAHVHGAQQGHAGSGEATPHVHLPWSSHHHHHGCHHNHAHGEHHHGHLDTSSHSHGHSSPDRHSHFHPEDESAKDSEPPVPKFELSPSCCEIEHHDAVVHCQQSSLLNSSSRLVLVESMQIANAVFSEPFSLKNSSRPMGWPIAKTSRGSARLDCALYLQTGCLRL